MNELRTQIAVRAWGSEGKLGIHSQPAVDAIFPFLVQRRILNHTHTDRRRERKTRRLQPWLAVFVKAMDHIGQIVLRTTHLKRRHVVLPPLVPAYR